MKHSMNILIFVGFLSVCLVQHIDSLPQAGRGWSPARPNATSYNNRWQQKFQTTRSPAQNQQPNWQSNGGWSWLIANNSAPRKSQQQQQQPQWQHGNGTHPFVGGAAYQSEGERVWLNSNQSHPFIQVPGFGDRPNFAIAKQPNRNNTLATVSNNAFGWRAPQPNYWAPVHNNSTQNVQTTRQPSGNNGWQGNPPIGGNWNIGRPSYNSTTGGQNAGNWYSPANTPTPPRNVSWTTPIKTAINTNWNGIASNGTSGSSVNSYAIWNSRLPGSTLVAGNNNQSAFFSSGPTAPARKNSDSGYSGFAPVGNGGQLPPVSYGASSSFGTPLAPLVGGNSWNSNPSQTGSSYSNRQQQPQARPINNSNPYANLFN